MHGKNFTDICKKTLSHYTNYGEHPAYIVGYFRLIPCISTELYGPVRFVWEQRSCPDVAHTSARH